MAAQPYRGCQVASQEQKRALHATQGARRASGSDSDSDAHHRRSAWRYRRGIQDHRHLDGASDGPQAIDEKMARYHNVLAESLLSECHICPCPCLSRGSRPVFQGTDVGHSRIIRIDVDQCVRITSF